jgi:hypothetical protein
MKIKKHIENVDGLIHNSLHSDIVNDKIIGKQLLFKGRVGNTWSIAIYGTGISYEYMAECDYNNDIKILIA